MMAILEDLVFTFPRRAGCTSRAAGLLGGSARRDIHNRCTKSHGILSLVFLPNMIVS